MGDYNESEFVCLVNDEGKTIYSLEWDSGAPGAGGGVARVVEYKDEYFTFTDWGMDGPFASVAEAVQEAGLNIVNSATISIDSAVHTVDELVGTLEIPDAEEADGTELLIKGEPWVVVKAKLERMADENDGEGSDENKGE